MNEACMIVRQSPPLSGTMTLHGAKNAVLAVMASLLLTRGKSVLNNVPNSADVLQMAQLLRELGAEVNFCPNQHRLIIDTTSVHKSAVDPKIMNKMRASVLVMGPLLARFGHAHIALPGGCVIGARPIDYHIKHFKKMGVVFQACGNVLFAQAERLVAQQFVLEYPSVGATENIMMAAVLVPGKTRIVNASLEPEVMEVVTVLKKMGARIRIIVPATIEVIGTSVLRPIEHTIMPDRLEAGALLLAAAITGGTITLPELPPALVDVFLAKLEDMGHQILLPKRGVGVTIKASSNPRAVSFKTGPFPSFPTDLQAPMMALQVVAQGSAVIEETVFENRLVHVRELQKLGAQIIVEGNKAMVIGVKRLHGTAVVATDIRASCSLLLAGLVAQGETIMTGLDHWYRGYDALEEKLVALGARVKIEPIKKNVSVEYEVRKCA